MAQGGRVAGGRRFRPRLTVSTIHEADRAQMPANSDHFNV
jgi:hypothetical protein